MIVFAWLAATIIAATAVAVALLARHTTISIIVRKDEDMPGLKQRIAALEAERIDTTAYATAARVDALDARVGAVEHEIDNEDAEPVVQPADPLTPVVASDQVALTPSAA